MRDVHFLMLALLDDGYRKNDQDQKKRKRETLEQLEEGGIHILRRQPRGEGGQKNAYFTK